MSKFTIKKAVKEQLLLRMSIIGVSGSGKTYTALRVGQSLSKTKLGAIDTERGSMAKYADLFDFYVIELFDDPKEREPFSPLNYVDALQALEEAGCDVIIIDSLSHAWSGKGGALEQVDKAAARSRSGNRFTAWRDVTPMHNKLVDALLNSPAHIITTMRAKSEYVIEDKDGKKVPRKVGMGAVQRDGMEYEFDVVADMDLQQNFVINKTRCSALKGEVFHEPGEDLAEIITTWLNTGEKASPKKPRPEPKKAELPQEGPPSELPPTGEDKDSFKVWFYKKCDEWQWEEKWISAAEAHLLKMWALPDLDTIRPDQRIKAEESVERIIRKTIERQRENEE